MDLIACSTQNNIGLFDNPKLYFYNPIVYMIEQLENLPIINRLLVEIAGHCYRNPIWLGSGPLGENIEDVREMLKSTAGIIIPRTTRLHYAPGRETNPPRHQDINIKTGTMRNAEWTGAPIEYWKPFLKEMAESGRVVMSVSGTDIKGCVEVCQILEEFHFPLLEINISCPQTHDLTDYKKYRKNIKRVVHGIKDAGVTTPISLKLGHSERIVEMAQIAEAAGADAITAINSYGPILDFDATEDEPKFTLDSPDGKGGLSGKAIFRIALTDVAALAQHIKIPIIACGGVETAEDVIKLLMAGASAVQVYTAAHLKGKHAPEFLTQLVAATENRVAESRYNSINGFRGSLFPALEKHKKRYGFPNSGR